MRRGPLESSFIFRIDERLSCSLSNGLSLLIEGMRKLRLYVARRDARKAARMKQTVLSKKAASSSSQAVDAKPKKKNEKNKDVGIFGVNMEEQTRMNLLSLRDWRRSAMEQRAGAAEGLEISQVVAEQCGAAGCRLVGSGSEAGGDEPEWQRATRMAKNPGVAWKSSTGRTRRPTRNGEGEQSCTCWLYPATTRKNAGDPNCIQGEAEDALEHLSIEKVTSESGYLDILNILDDRYKELQQ